MKAFLVQLPPLVLDFNCSLPLMYWLSKRTTHAGEINGEKSSQRALPFSLRVASGDICEENGTHPNPKQPQKVNTSMVTSMGEP